MIDNEFCSTLEYAIRRVLSATENDTTKGFWCDGVMTSGHDEYYSADSVKGSKCLILTAFVGQDGQTAYELMLHFGPIALRNYIDGLSLEECIPSPLGPHSFSIDPDSKRIAIHLL